MQAGTFSFVWVLISSLNELSQLLIFVAIALFVVNSFRQAPNSSKSNADKRPRKPTQPKTISCSFCADQAISLPKPDPRSTAHDNVFGIVTVDILIDENGDLVSASLASGHPLLRVASIVAARKAKFPPTFIDGKRIRVRTNIVSNFLKK